MLSLCHAMRYCEAERFQNDKASFSKARSFVNNFMPKIVVVLLDLLEIGDVVSTSESSRIKSCLESAMVFAINELRMTTIDTLEIETATTAIQSVTVIANILDETRIVYDLTEKNELLRKIWNYEGLQCLEKWLRLAEGTELFPE
jgi:hypothetical protein